MITLCTMRERERDDYFVYETIDEYGLHAEKACWESLANSSPTNSWEARDSGGPTPGVDVNISPTGPHSSRIVILTWPAILIRIPSSASFLNASYSSGQMTLWVACMN